LVPVAGLAVATGLQRWMDGPAPAGDFLVRWLAMASCVSLVLGAIAGLSLSKRALPRALWAAWGAASPLLLAAALLLGVKAARPLRDYAAARGQQRCRDEGRPACTSIEFRTHCAAAAKPGADAAKLLGAPWQELCSNTGCTRRYRYIGPWTPDDYVAPGSIVCSVVTDAQGAPQRFAMGPGSAP
jgi:hypothetical protein